MNVIFTSIPSVITKTESLSSNYSRFRTTSRIGSFSDNSSMYRFKGIRPFAERGISLLLKTLPTYLILEFAPKTYLQG